MYAPSLLHTALMHRPALDHPALPPRRRVTRGTPAPLPAPHTLVIRDAQALDAGPVARLEQLDGRRLPAGERIVAEADGRLVAAAELASGRAVADPFAPSSGVLDLLRVHLDNLRATQVVR